MTEKSPEQVAAERETQIARQNNAALPVVKAPLVAGNQMKAFYPQTIDEALRYAQMILASGVYPESIKKKGKDEQVATIIGTMFKGMEVGLPPMSALSGIMEVNGRYCVWGDAALGLCYQSGMVEWTDEKFEGTWGSDDFKAVCTIKRKGNPHAIVREFTWAAAKTAKLNAKTIWLAYPKRMLQMRARSWALRDGFSDVLQGLGIVEEVRDIPETTKEPVATDFLDAGFPQLTQQPMTEPHIATAERPVEETQPPKEECLLCQGHGIDAANEELPCPACGGTGNKQDEQQPNKE